MRENKKKNVVWLEKEGRKPGGARDFPLELTK